MIFSKFLTAAILWGVSSCAVAVSLGRTEGTVLLGRPLSMSVLLSLDEAEASAESCVSAEVFYADTRVENSRVRVSLEKMPSGQDTFIRVRASTVVDEPVVTVLVRAGCTRMVERRYVLLADPVAPQTSPPVTQAEPREDQTAKKRLVLPSVLANPPTTSSAPVRSSRSLAQTPTEQASGASRSVSRGAAVRPSVKPAARLKLEPLDLTPETLPQLRASSEMLSVPAASAGQRALAAALWKALMAEPEDLLKDAEKMSSIETDLRRLSAESKTNQLALTELQAQIQVQKRDARLWIGALLTMLVLVGCGFLLWRRWSPQHSAPWWHRKKSSKAKWFASQLGGNADVGRDSAPVASDVMSSKPPDRSTRTQPPPPPSRIASRPSSGFMPPSSRRGHTDFALSMPHTPRALKAEELFDVQHQAEFFISIGQHDQAVAVLRNHISEDTQTSALIYLDLFNLYHQLKRHTEFDELRVEFSRLFNAEIPAFDSYSETKLGLQAQEVAVSRIDSLWPSPKVLEVIKEDVFREPGDQAKAFDLEAYRELLRLEGIAKEIVEAQPAANASLLDLDLPSLPPLEQESTSNQGPASTKNETNQGPSLRLPLEYAADSTAVLPATPAHRGVDIDLNALEAERPFVTAGVPAGMTAVSKTPPVTATAASVEFSDFNLIDFELPGESCPPESQPKKP